MPDESKNTISEEISIPPSPQEPMADIPVPTSDPTPTETPLEAPESPINADIPVSLNNDNPQNEPISTPSPIEATPVEPIEMPVNPASNEPNEPPIVSNPEPVETPTAQTPPNEPFTPEPEVKPEPLKPEPVSAPNYESKPEPIPVILPPKNSIRELLVKAKNAIQFRKRKKLEKIMSLFLKKSKITNDEVEKFLHVSDATATRYLSQLEKENKTKQVGKTGHTVSYSRI